MLWANTRLLHARTAFEPDINQSRTLEGCYFDWDIVRSKIRLIRDRYEMIDNQPSI